jgi:TRAP-type C4-dicarboxylate transport system permease large subunit
MDRRAAIDSATLARMILFILASASSFLWALTIVLLIAMALDAFLPPSGVGFYVCRAIAQSTIEQASRAMLQYQAY